MRRATLARRACGLTRRHRAQDVDSQQCRAQLDQAADDLAALRRTNADLLSAFGGGAAHLRHQRLLADLLRLRAGSLSLLRRELTPEQLAKVADSGAAGLGAAGGTAQWAGQAALGNRPWISHRAGDEAQEDPWDEETGALKRPPPADGPPGVQLLPRPPASLAAAAEAAAAAARANAPVVAHVVILACDRADYLARTLASVARVHNGDVRFPLHISQDGTNTAVADVARAAAATTGVRYMQHQQARAACMQRTCTLI